LEYTVLMCFISFKLCNWYSNDVTG